MATKIKVYDLATGTTVAESTAPVEQHGFRKFTQVLWRKSFRYSALAGQDNKFSEKFSTDVYVFGGAYYPGMAAVDGDSIEFSVVDKDNVLGFGAGAILSKFIETEFVVPGLYEKIQMDDASLVPAGLYLQARYVSGGGANVPLIVRYFLRLP